VPQAPNASKSQTKIIFDVGGFHLAPSMTIVLAIHASHLSRMASWKMDGQQFKNDVAIKCDGQRGNIFDFDLVVV
jgi:hypothetical protein